MKTISIIILICLPLLGISQNKVVKGNGRIVTEQKVLPSYDAVYVDLFCDVFVTVGSMPMANISADKNTVNKIDLVVRNNELRIEVKEGFWLQSARPQIYLQTPYLTKITTRGQQTNVGTIKVEGIAVDQFETDLLYGEVILQGNAKKLLLKSSNRSYYSNRSTLDASQLNVNVVDAIIQGSNTAKINAREIVTVDLMHDAVLEYVNEPIEIQFNGDAIQIANGVIGVKGALDEQESEIKVLKKANKLQYVALKIKNNSLVRKHFVIRGPNESGSEFSYGFPMMPLATRDKKVPVGTKIFLQKNGMGNKKLITITADDEGKVVNLFDE